MKNKVITFNQTPVRVFHRTQKIELPVLVTSKGSIFFKNGKPTLLKIGKTYYTTQAKCPVEAVKVPTLDRDMLYSSMFLDFSRTRPSEEVTYATLSQVNIIEGPKDSLSFELPSNWVYHSKKKLYFRKFPVFSIKVRKWHVQKIKLENQKWDVDTYYRVDKPQSITLRNLSYASKP